jgi:hypothetical protein
MFHATNARLGRQARKIRDIRLAGDNQAATAHGWQTQEIRPGTWRYRDPRFGHRASTPSSTPPTRLAVSNGGS